MASTLITDEVLALILPISASGMATRTFTRLTSSIVTTACEGMAVSPAPTCLRPMIPLTGATSRQSRKFLRATSNCDLACATLLCTSTHCTSGSEPLSCSMA